MHYLGQLSDLPLPHTNGQRLRTRRKPVAQIVLCQGCCCGQTVRGLPGVPLDWLKPLWKSERLNKVVQLTVSGCLGPCDLPNVCCIVTPDEQAWYGRLTNREDYAVLLGWARRCRDESKVLPFPAELEHLRFERWPGRDDQRTYAPIAQDPADIILLTAADTEVLTWSHAASGLPPGFPSFRALNIDRLRDRNVFDAYLDDVLQDSRVIILRILGGMGYWGDQIEQIRLLARAHGIALVCLAGEAAPDAELATMSTVPLHVADTIFRYSIEGGVDNTAAMLRYVSDSLLGTSYGHVPPTPLPQVGIYYPGCAGVLTIEDWQQQFCKADQPTVAIAFYRSHWVTGNVAAIDALAHALEIRGLNVLPLFGPNLDAILQSSAAGAGVDLLIATTSFSINAGRTCDKNELNAAGDVPILQAICSSSSENVWAANIAGLSPRDIAMNVALPEFDGRIITTAISFKNTVSHDDALQTDVIRYEPRADRIEHVADLARNWAHLRHTPNRDKKVAILLANYPSKNARVGNAVGLDTPASLHDLLLALGNAGYDLGDHLPPDGQALIEALIASSTQDLDLATERAFADRAGWVTPEQYRRWLDRCPSSARDGIVNRWGNASQSPQYYAPFSWPTPGVATQVNSRAEGFPIPGLLFGNVFIGIQPARGYDQDPSAAYHSPDLQPPPFYLAFYRWLGDIFGAHAVIHLGKHGNLEWLPGKGTALSAACYPEVMLGAVPLIYPFIINNPGEGTQAKRRAAAVIVDHLIPPMTRADSYGELRQLELLLDEYYEVQTLDPVKAPLVLESITQLIRRAQLHCDLDLAAVPETEQLPALLNRLSGYVCEIKEAQIRDGLHILGSLPRGEPLVGLLFSLVQLNNGQVLALPSAIASDWNLDYTVLRKDLGGQFTAEMHPELASCRTHGNVIEILNLLSKRLIETCLRTQNVQEAIREVFSLTRHEMQKTRGSLRYLWENIWPRLQRCPDEIDHILLALDGRFVPPGPSGAPTRGSADILPTGRNFYSLDVRTIPTQTAWRVGCAAANTLLERHRERTGSFPESIAMVVWGTSNMRTHGDDIAEILFLLGVRPRWDDDNRRVIGIEAIPLVELGRPRIDVTVRISGLFRDAFPNLVRFLNDAVDLVAGLEEPLDRNFVRAHIARDTAFLSTQKETSASSSAPTVPVEQAARMARLRVFGSKPGAYGAGLLPVIDGRNWASVKDLARVYLTWSSYAYRGVAEDDGREEVDALRLRLAQSQVVAQNQDNREHDIFDSDDYFQFHGGLIATIRALTGQPPAAYFGDTSKPEDVRARTLKEETCRVFRARVVNPRWLAGMMRHGYKGAVEMAATVDYLFGYDATADIIDDWMYERVAASYLLDDPVRNFLRRVNPWAERAMIERLLEAAERGLWEHPDPATLSALSSQHGGNEAWLEGLETHTLAPPPARSALPG